MFTKNIKDTFTASLLSAVSGVLGEAKKKPCSEGCECEACVPEEDTNEGYMPTNDMPSAKDRATAGKLGALLKRERDAKEKKEPNGVKTEETEVEENYVSHAQRKAVWANRADDGKGHPDKKKKMKEESEEIDEAGLWDNIHAKRKRIKAGSGERMRKVGEKGAPTPAGIKSASNEEAVGDITVKKISPDEAFKKHTGQMTKKTSVPKDPKTGKTLYQKVTSEEIEELDEVSKKLATSFLNKTEPKSDFISGGEGKQGHEKGRKLAFSKLARHSQAKIPATEETQIDELSKATMGRYINKAKDSIDMTSYRSGIKDGTAISRNDPYTSENPLEKKLSKRHKGIETAVKKLTKEEVEELDELSTKTLDSYRSKARKDIIDADANDDIDTYNKRTKGYTKATKNIRKNFVKGVDEEVEELDELSKGTMGRYINRAATKMGSQGVTAGLKIAADEKSSKNFKDMGKREKGIKLAVSKLTKEEQDFIDLLNDVDMEQIDELSKDTLKKYKEKARDDFYDADDVDDGRRVRRRYTGLKMASKKLAKEEVEELDELSKNSMLKYLSANKKDDIKARETGDYDKMTKRMRGTDMAVRKYTAKPGSKSVRVPATEEVELDEARGRPRKAGARDFTIHPKTKEKLMHDNPAHMKKIELLQKNGILQKPKTEANQHIIQQLQRAKLSMRGGETVNFTHGDPHHVAGTHASKLLDKYAGMKPDEKEAFQKKIGHSHANLKSEL